MKSKRQPTAEQKEKAEARRAAFRQLVKQVAAMDESQRAEIVSKCGGIVTCEGRTLSVYNSCLVLSQNEGASMVGGFKQWLAKGRAVKKGEHGLAIWIPTQRKNAEAGEGEAGEGEPDMNFIMGYVFDVSQTQEVEQ